MRAPEVNRLRTHNGSLIDRLLFQYSQGPRQVQCQHWLVGNNKGTFWRRNHPKRSQTIPMVECNKSRRDCSLR